MVRQAPETMVDLGDSHIFETMYLWQLNRAMENHHVERDNATIRGHFQELDITREYIHQKPYSQSTYVIYVHQFSYSSEVIIRG